MRRKSDPLNSEALRRGWLHDHRPFAPPRSRDGSPPARSRDNSETIPGWHVFNSEESVLEPHKAKPQSSNHPRLANVVEEYLSPKLTGRDDDEEAAGPTKDIKKRKAAIPLSTSDPQGTRRKSGDVSSLFTGPGAADSIVDEFITPKKRQKLNETVQDGLGDGIALPPNAASAPLKIAVTDVDGVVDNENESLQDIQPIYGEKKHGRGLPPRSNAVVPQPAIKKTKKKKKTSEKAPVTKDSDRVKRLKQRGLWIDPQDVQEGHRQCEKCGQVRPDKEFVKATNSYDVMKNFAKTCDACRAAGNKPKRQAREDFDRVYVSQTHRICFRCKGLHPVHRFISLRDYYESTYETTGARVNLIPGSYSRETLQEIINGILRAKRYSDENLEYLFHRDLTEITEDEIAVEAGPFNCIVTNSDGSCSLEVTLLPTRDQPRDCLRCRLQVADHHSNMRINLLNKLLETDGHDIHCSHCGRKPKGQTQLDKKKLILATFEVNHKNPEDKANPPKNMNEEEAKDAEVICSRCHARVTIEQLAATLKKLKRQPPNEPFAYVCEAGPRCPYRGEKLPARMLTPVDCEESTDRKKMYCTACLHLRHQENKNNLVDSIDVETFQQQMRIAEQLFDDELYKELLKTHWRTNYQRWLKERTEE